MKQLTNIFLLTLFIATSLIGCVVTGEQEHETGMDSLSIQVNFFENSLETGNLSILRSLPENVVKVAIKLTGINIDKQIEYDLIKINGIWQGIIGNVPSGITSVSACAYNNANTLIYQTSADINVVSGQKINVSLTLQPVEPAPVYDVNAPKIDCINIIPQKVAPECNIKLETIAHDPAPGGLLVYTWMPANIGKFNDRSSSKPIWTAPKEEGYYQLTVTIIDEEYLVDHFTFTVEVNKKYGSGSIGVTTGFNNYPIISNMTSDPTRIDKGGSANLEVDAYDIDGDELKYSWHSDLPGKFDDPTAMNPTFTIDSNVQYGSCKLSVDVSDGTLTTTGNISINISGNSEVNTSPIIQSVFQSADKVSPNGTVVLIVRANDPESTPVNFTWSASAGTFDTQSDTNSGDYYQSNMIWKAPSSGSGIYKITVTVKDATGLGIQYDFSVALQ